MVCASLWARYWIIFIYIRKKGSSFLKKLFHEVRYRIIKPRGLIPLINVWLVLGWFWLLWSIYKHPTALDLYNLRKTLLFVYWLIDWLESIQDFSVPEPLLWCLSEGRYWWTHTKKCKLLTFIYPVTTTAVLIDCLCTSIFSKVRVLTTKKVSFDKRLVFQSSGRVFPSRVC